MNDQQFDKILKNKLDGLEAPYDPASWDLLAKKMDAPYSEEFPEAVSEVDKAVYRSLQQLEAPYEPAHWAAMEQQLGKAQRTGRVLWIKLAEAAVFLLLVTYLGGLVQFGKQGEVPIRATGPVAYLYPSQEDGKPTENGWSVSENTTKRAQGVLLESLGEPALYQQIAPASALETIAGEMLSALSEMQRLTDGSEPDADPLLALPDMALLPVSGAPALDRSLLSAAGYRVAAPPIRPAPRTRHIYVYSLVSADHNQAVAGNYRNRATGYSAGMGAGYRGRSWGFEAGAAYASRSFSPKKSIVLFDGNVTNGYYGTNLQSVEADMLSVPVRATRRLLKAGKAEVLAVAGASAHVALQKSNRYETVYFPGQSPTGLPTITADQQAELRPAAKGLLEGGRLSGNAYLTADAGLRVEYPISKRYSAFVEPVYRRAFGDGIGPNPSKIHTVSVSAGVITTI